MERPGSSKAPAGAFWRAKATWKIGFRPRSRSGWSSSTIRSNGRSCCSNAPRIVSRARTRSSRNGGSPAQLTRRARALTKNPMRSSIFGSVRLALEPLARERLALPDGEVGVLDGQLRERRGAPRGETLVERGDLAHEHAHRPAVRHDVVHRQEEYMVGGGETHEARAHQRAARE